MLGIFEPGGGPLTPRTQLGQQPDHRLPASEARDDTFFHVSAIQSEQREVTDTATIVPVTISQPMHHPPWGQMH